MHTKDDICDMWMDLHWEASTRTFSRPEHWESFDRRQARFEAACRASGFDQAEIGKMGMARLRTPNAEAHGRAVARTVQPLVGGPNG